MIPASDLKILGGAALVLIPVSMLPALIWHDRRNFAKRDAALTLPWLVLLSLVTLVLGALSGSLAFPLEDALFISADRAIGISGPAVMAWTAAHPAVSDLLGFSYDLLPYMLLIAIGVSAFGEKRAAWIFLVANAIAEAIAFPLFALFPAIGPWAGYGFEGNAAQKLCEASVWSLRAGGHGQSAGIVCFPSFHVIWALFAAWALWQIKWLRIPACLLAFLITLSTVTTGWHYAIDAIAGIFITVVSISCAETIVDFLSERNGTRIAVKAGPQLLGCGRRQDLADDRGTFLPLFLRALNFQVSSHQERELAPTAKTRLADSSRIFSTRIA
jgi:hypothetical protein